MAPSSVKLNSDPVRFRSVHCNGDDNKNEKSSIDEDLCADVFGASGNNESGLQKSKGAQLENEEVGNTLLTNPDLIKEEEELRIKNEKKHTEEEAKLKKEEDDGMSPEDRYKKLSELLSKSKFYSNFLLEKMEREDEESKKLKSKNLSGRKSSKGKNHEFSEPSGKKKKYGQERTYNGESIPDDQPLLLSGGIMRDYQLKGYQWMATLYENGINGILADEMGLGKTLQTIALFSHLVEMGVPGPFMVIAPLSTIANWVREFNKFAPLLPVVLYHGSAKEREAIRDAKVRETVHLSEEETGLNGGRKVRNTFVTSYEIAMNDQQHFKKVRWLYMVVDEGHRLKNMNCRLIKSLKQYTSSNRLLLTGTPLQNNLDELWSLLNFLMSEIFDDLRIFRSWFDAKDIHHDESETNRILRQEQQGSILSTLHQILTPFLLRRVKADVDLKIPPKKEVLVYCPLTEKQRAMYEATVGKTIQDLVGKKKKEEVMGIFKHDKLVGHTGDLNEERKKRSAATKIDYSAFLDMNPGEGDKSFKTYVEKMREIQNELESRQRAAMSCSLMGAEKSRDAEINFSVKSRLMDLRKTCNHPYLIEYPLTDDGNFYRSDEDMVDICGKLKVLDQMLKELIKRKHKILIFSQMTKLLDILADYLEFRGLKFARLDGAMHFEDRQANIDLFNTSPEHCVFLLSTRAGGLGINLTAADTVVIYDSDWNPQQDLQAQDRAHRIGQTKPVMVYRLVTANTIDERIVERAAAKRKLEKMIIHKNKFKSQDTDGLKKTMQSITPQELLELLDSKDHTGVIDRKDQSVFTKEELDMLLDRTDLTWERLAQKQKLAENTGKKKKKQGEKFGYTSVATDDELKENGDKALAAAKHFKVIDTDGLPQGLQSIK